MNIMFLNNIVTLGAVKNVFDTFVNNYLLYAFLGAIAIAAFIAVWKKSFRTLAVIIAVGVLGGILIFNGNALFGKNGTMTNSGKKIAKELNAITPFAANVTASDAPLVLEK